MNKEYNDYELIDIVSENNEEALELIINKYQPIIKYISTKKLKIANSLGMDISDLYQEGLIGLLEAIRDFKDVKGVTFYTFANLCIERQINTSLTKHNRKRDKILNTAISLDKKILDSEKTLLEIIEPINNVTALHDIISLESDQELYTNIKKKLSDFEKKVFDLKINNYSYDEIALKLGVTSKEIYSAMRRIKDKIKKAINKE
jgi:RNA polymerase sporulation-specific sigma factor